ncbi:MAG: hypothetical protein Q4C53_06335 [Clostridia bacterium]|nr:hypothetical protein [Clostridia bacterium]
MKIYSIISRIENALEDGPRSKFSGSKGNFHIVDIDVIGDMIGDLKITIPEDIRKATGIINDANQTIADANERARQIVETAKEEAERIVAQAQASAEEIYQNAQDDFERMVSESAIIEEASVRAGDIMNEAETNANAIYNGARTYADGILADIQRYLSEYHALISDNRKELEVVPAEEMPAAPVTAEEQYFDDDFIADGLPQQNAAPDAYEEYGDYYDAPGEFEEEPYEDEVYEEEAPAPSKPLAFIRNVRSSKAKAADADDEEAPSAKPKKKGLLSKFFEVDYDDDDEDEEDEPKAKPAHGKKRR